MDKKWIAIIIVFIVALAAVSAYFLISSKKTALSPAATSLEACKSLIYNGENKISIVFFSTQEYAQKYADKMLATSPFSTNRQAFNFYYIDNYQPECELYKDVALLCYSDELIKKAGSCPNDYIIVVQDKDSKIRSSAYMNVISLNSKLSTAVFAHEFGHAFANLADEYVPATPPRNSKNCVSSCSEFADSSSCFQGCSKAELYRSVDAGIMKTLSSNTFGSVNEGLITSRISDQTAQKITAMAVGDIVSCENEQYYLVKGNYTNGKMQIISRTIEQGCIGSNGAGSFNYSLVLQDDTRQYKGEFNAELIFIDDQTAEETAINGGTFNNEGIFLLKIPIVDTAKAIELSTDRETMQVSLENRGAWPCEII
jgi:hypothetical protein